MVKIIVAFFKNICLLMNQLVLYCYNSFLINPNYRNIKLNNLPAISADKKRLKSKLRAEEIGKGNSGPRTTRSENYQNLLSAYNKANSHNIGLDRPIKLRKLRKMQQRDSINEM
jgi:hypothetical protein